MILKLVPKHTFFFCILPLLVAASTTYAQKSSPPHLSDPYADPANDPYNPLRYIASDTLTGISFSLVVLTAVVQSWLIWLIGGQYMLAMIIAEYTFAAGLGLRFGLHAHPDSRGIYIAEYLLVVLSPCGFIAANYVLLGRLSRWLKCDEYLLIPPNKITLVFVVSDVVTFLIQAAGGSISISNNRSVALGGSHIFLAGLALQLVSFVIFTGVYLLFLFRVSTQAPQIWFKDRHLKWYRDWRALAGALSISCIGILIRSVYRTIELSEGFHGRLATTEGFFYGLDTLPLFVALVIYIPFWPGRFIASAEGSPGVGNEKIENSIGEAQKDSMGDSEGMHTDELTGRAM